MNSDEIIKKLEKIEKSIEELNKNINDINQEYKDNQNSQILLLTKIENIADFIRNQYNIVIEDEEKFTVIDKNYRK